MRNCGRYCNDATDGFMNGVHDLLEHCFNVFGIGRGLARAKKTGSERHDCEKECSDSESVCGRSEVEVLYKSEAGCSPTFGYPRTDLTPVPAWRPVLETPTFQRSIQAEGVDFCNPRRNNCSPQFFQGLLSPNCSNLSLTRR